MRSFFCTRPQLVAVVELAELESLLLSASMSSSLCDESVRINSLEELAETVAAAAEATGAPPRPASARADAAGWARCCSSAAEAKRESG